MSENLKSLINKYTNNIYHYFFRYFPFWIIFLILVSFILLNMDFIISLLGEIKIQYINDIEGNKFNESTSQNSAESKKDVKRPWKAYLIMFLVFIFCVFVIGATDHDERRGVFIIIERLINNNNFPEGDEED